MTIRTRRPGKRSLAMALPAILSIVGLASATHATCHLDTDADGVPDPYDNCIDVPNTGQRDTNQDGVGNQCDPDYNQDGRVDAVDFGVFLASFVGTAVTPDADHDGDGLTNVVDFGVFVSYFGGGVNGESGLACVTGPEGGPIPCEVTEYDEIVATALVAATALPPQSAPTLGEIEADGELFVFASPGYETLTAPEIVDFTTDGVYTPAGPFTSTTLAAGEVVSRWVFHADAETPLTAVLPGGAAVEFADSEEVLGVKLVSAVSGTLLDFNGGDALEIAGQSILLDVPTRGVQLEVLTRCAPEIGVTLSIDPASASIGDPAEFPIGALLEAADLLTVGSPAAPGPNPPDTTLPIPAPGEMIDGAVLTGALGMNVDAVSYADDHGAILWFSVDEAAGGLMIGLAPNVRTEGARGNLEAAADVFEWDGMLPGLAAGVAGNTALFDGDGSFPFGGPGFGLDETIVGGQTYAGDDLDAFDGDTTPDDLAGNIFFSLDAASAAALGFSGADVILSEPGNALTGYLDASDLGLSAIADDIDALALEELESTSPQFDPAVDRVHFSLRAGSASIGMLDCRFMIPIEPGDVLTTPCMAGGPPAIAVRAEDLGLRAVRVGNVTSDELDALDRVPTRRTHDEDPDGNGQPD